MADLTAEDMLEVASVIADPRTVPDGAFAYAVVPNNAKLEHLERLLPAPVRPRATVTAKSVDTLCAYVSRYATENSVIFGDQQSFQIVGILDYHPKDGAAWAEHRVHYQAPRSLEWQTWRGSNKKAMSQADFARFIEDNLVDIREPTGADVLEVSRSLQAKKSVEFASAIRLADGAQEFTYNETVSGTTSKGKIKVPEEFTLGIPVFFAGPLYEVRARLRYRINEGKLSLWYDLYRPEHIEKDAFEQVCAEVAGKTAIEVWQGTP